MTALLDWISQQLTTAPLWIQSPIVILGAVLVCALMAVPLLRFVDLLGMWVSGTTRVKRRSFPPAGQAVRTTEGGTRIISESQPS